MALARKSPRSILLIEDDADLCALMRDFFVPHDLEVQSASDGRAGLAQALSDAYDLVILGVMLPVIDGFEVLRQIRRRSEVPIIMLTARTAQNDRVTGLEQGADDYLPKPFEPDEPLARIPAATTSSPAPVSPQTRTALSTGATRLISSSKARNLGLEPIRSNIAVFLLAQELRVSLS
jgi:DNA-binding response OmpR family regulator